jgi:hypothetical protein
MPWRDAGVLNAFDLLREENHSGMVPKRRGTEYGAAAGNSDIAKQTPCAPNGVVRGERYSQATFAPLAGRRCPSCLAGHGSGLGPLRQDTIDYRSTRTPLPRRLLKWLAKIVAFCFPL